jgi:tetratricopeptide (TPR) repeat protein
LSCHTGSKTTSASKGKELNEDQKKMVDYLFIDGCKERLAGERHSGRLENAEAQFNKALVIDPQNAAIKYELAKIYELTGRMDQAIACSKSSVELDPKNQWYHIRYIECLHMKKLYAQAAEAYAQLVKQFPDRSDWLESEAIEYALAGNFSKSFKIYDELEKRYGTNETFTINKIKLLKQQRKYSDAEGELKKLIDSNPTESRFYSYLAEYYEDINDFQKAKAVYDKMLTLDSNNPMVHLAIANYYKQQGKAEESQTELKTAFASPDLDVYTKLKILESYFNLSEQYPEYTPKAYELCTILLKVNPTSAEAHSIYADYLARDRKNEEARVEYLKALSYDKSNYVIWERLMFAEHDMNQNDSLEKHSSAAIELFPSQSKPYLFNGAANIALKNYKKAIKSLNDGLEFEEMDKPVLLGIYSNLGEAYNYTKEYEKSDKAFEDALKIDPDNDHVLNNYAYYLSLRNEKLEKAEKYAKRCTELYPNRPDYLDTYGWILFQMKRYKEAEEYLARVVKVSPKNPVFLEHYGDILFKLDKVEQAVNYWKLAQDSGGKSESLTKKLVLKKINE